MTATSLQDYRRLYRHWMRPSTLLVLECWACSVWQRRWFTLNSLLIQELDVPFYRTPQELAKILKAETPPLDTVWSALLNSGYSVSSSHCCAGAFKTDAPTSVVWDMMKAWVYDSYSFGLRRLNHILSSKKDWRLHQIQHLPESLRNRRRMSLNCISNLVLMLIWRCVRMSIQKGASLLDLLSCLRIGDQEQKQGRKRAGHGEERGRENLTMIP